MISCGSWRCRSLVGLVTLLSLLTCGCGSGAESSDTTELCATTHRLPCVVVPDEPYFATLVATHRKGSESACPGSGQVQSYQIQPGDEEWYVGDAGPSLDVDATPAASGGESVRLTILARITPASLASAQNDSSLRILSRVTVDLRC